MVDIAGKQVPKWLIVLVAVGVVVGIGGSISSCIERKMSGGRSGVAQSSATTVAPTPARKPNPSFAQGEVSEASVRSALPGIKLVKLEVQDNLGSEAADDKIVHITYKPKGVADQSPRLTLMDLAKVSATVFEKLFANAAVGAVDVTAQVPMVYTGGSEKNEAGARIYWDRKKADSVDFKKYRDNVAESYFWDAYVGAPDFYVHPGVLGGLSETDQAKLRK